MLSSTFVDEAGNDMLSGDKGDDVLIGGAGMDTLEGGAGADKVKGGAFVMPGMPAGTPVAGGDGQFTNAAGPTATYSGSDGGVTIDLTAADPGNTVDDDRVVNSNAPVLVLGMDAGGHAAGDTLYGIENLTGSGHGDMLTGTNAAAGNTGGEGDDMLTGGDGQDTLLGGKGDDTLVADNTDTIANLMGGAGMDTLDFTESEADVNIELGARHESEAFAVRGY